jgi:hypothetical protein
MKLALLENLCSRLVIGREQGKFYVNEKGVSQHRELRQRMLIRSVIDPKLKLRANDKEYDKYYGLFNDGGVCHFEQYP